MENHEDALESSEETINDAGLGLRCRPQENWRTLHNGPQERPHPFALGVCPPASQWSLRKQAERALAGGEQL